MIKHHNYYKVHLPKKDYKGESDEFAEVIMEEFYLVSNGEWTKNYIPTNPKTDQFEISLYPSILYAANKLNYSENEKFKIINDFFREAYSCSRPYLIKLLENNEIEYRKIGKHRRILLKDVLNYREKMKAAQKQAIIDIMEADEKDGLYDT